jgi:hypothetical protein
MENKGRRDLGIWSPQKENKLNEDVGAIPNMYRCHTTIE